MSGFSFDAKAALERARKSPALPTFPTDGQAKGGKGGTVGTVGTVHAFDPETTPEELTRNIYEGRASIREHDGGQTHPEDERAAWQEARRTATITALDEWRARADDVHNPENWR